MRPLLPLLVLLAPALGAGCSDACERRCADLEGFYEECAEQLDDAGVVLQCYDDDVEAYEDGSLDPSDARSCTDGRDFRDSCLLGSRARARAMPPKDNAERLDECQQDDAWIRAVRQKDCDAAVAAWLERTED